jgi:hypothetical protein
MYKEIENILTTVKEKNMKEALIGLIIAVIIVSAVFLYKFNKPEKIEEKPEPKPEPPKEAEEPIEEAPIFEAPVIEVAKVTQNEILIKWQKVEAEELKLYLNTDNAGGWEAILRLDGSTNSYHFTELQPENEYKILIQAIKGGEKINSRAEVIKTKQKPVVLPDWKESPIYDIELDAFKDNTESLQSQLDKIPNGNKNFPVIVRFPKGAYNVEGTLEEKQRYATKIYRKHYWKIEAEGCNLYVNEPAHPFGGNVNKGEYSHRRQFCLVECNEVDVHKIRVTGANVLEGKKYREGYPSFWKGAPDNSAPEGFHAYVDYWAFEHNIEIVNSHNIRLHECVGSMAFGDGIYLHGDCTNIELVDCISEFAGRQGLGCNAVKGLKVIRIKIVKARRSGVDMETDFEEAIIRDVKIYDSEIECHLTPFAAGGPGIVNDVEIDNNKYSGSGNSVYCRSNNLKVRRENWKFTNNERLNTFGSSAPCLKFGKTDNVLIENNIDHYQGEYYVGNSFADGLVVRNNKLTGGNKIRVHEMTNIDHSGNTPELEIFKQA